MKRALDVMIALALLVAAAPLIAMAGGALRLANRGPVFFGQRREARGGGTFTLWKIRTMYVDADARLTRYLADHPDARDEWARYRRIAGDPRIVPGVGRLLRRTSIDELPQLWNVVRGEMSLVGPRPLELEALERFDPENRRMRQRVRPGLTGLWQVSGRSDTDLRRCEELDVAYVRTRTARLDAVILARTVIAVMSGRGAY